MNNEYIIANKSDLISVADAIRSKTNATDQLGFPSDMISAISSISGSTSGTVSSSEITIVNDSLSSISYYIGKITGSTLQSGYTYDGRVDTDTFFVVVVPTLCTITVTGGNYTSVDTCCLIQPTDSKMTITINNDISSGGVMITT